MGLFSGPGSHSAGGGRHREGSHRARAPRTNTGGRHREATVFHPFPKGHRFEISNWLRSKGYDV